VNYTYIIIKSSLKITFLWKILETKKFAEIFCEAFLIEKKNNILLSHPRLYSVLKKSINKVKKTSL
jgi:hypothetical protein